MSLANVAQAVSLRVSEPGAVATGSSDPFSLVGSLIPSLQLRVLTKKRDERASTLVPGSVTKQVIRNQPVRENFSHAESCSESRLQAGIHRLRVAA